MSKSKSFASDRCARYLKAVGAAERLRIIARLLRSKERQRTLRRLRRRSRQGLALFAGSTARRRGQRPQGGAICDLHAQSGGL